MVCKPRTKKDLEQCSDEFSRVYEKLYSYKEELGYSPSDRRQLDLAIEYMLAAYKALDKHITEEIKEDGE